MCLHHVSGSPLCLCRRQCHHLVLGLARFVGSRHQKLPSHSVWQALFGFGCCLAMAMHSSYIWEVLTLPNLDWMTRHEKFLALYPRTQKATRDRMPPDLRLWGRLTGTPVQRGQVIALPDKVRYKQSRLSDFFKVTKKVSTRLPYRYEPRKVYKQLCVRCLLLKAKP